MKPNQILSLIIALLTTPIFISPAFGQNAGEQWNGACVVTFSGNSTLHPFSGTVKAEPFSLTVTNPQDPANAQVSGSVLVKAAKMASDNDRRDKKMRQCMDVKGHPDILVDIGTLSAAATKPDTSGEIPQPTEIPFTLTLKGKKHQKIAQVSNWKNTESSISCTVTFPVSLAASNIKPPVMLGVVKVDDTIQISANLSLQRK